MPNVFAVYYKGRPLKETFPNKLLLTPEKLITMKSYRSPLNNSDGIFSVSFPYRSPIILLSSSYCEAENNTEWNEKRTNEVRWNKGGQFYHYLSFGFRQGGLKALLWV